MKTVIAVVAGTPVPGGSVIFGYRSPRGGQTEARRDIVEGDTPASIAAGLQSQIGSKWLGDDAFNVRLKEPSSLVIICTDRVVDVAFFSQVDGSDGLSIEVTEI